MRRNLGTVCLLAVILSLAALGREVRGQGGSRIGTSPISHIGIAVPDDNAAARDFADVFDLPVPAINEKNALAQPDGSPAAVARAATLLLPNFLIELQQPATTWGPIYDTVQKFGRTVHHISFGVADNYGEMRDGLTQKGARWTGGTRETGWAYLDFRGTLGATFEPLNVPIQAMLVKRMTGVAPSTTLGTQPVTRIGLVVRNADEAARAYADALGIPVPKVTEVPSLGFPKGTAYNRKAHVKRASWMHDNNIAIELLEPVGGPSPWSEALERQHGNSVHHLTFNVGDRLDAMIRLLETKGGRLIYGSAAAGSAYLDFTDKLGIVLEVRSTP